MIQERKAPYTFTVQLPDGRLFKRHIDHIRNREPLVDEMLEQPRSNTYAQEQLAPQRHTRLQPPAPPEAIPVTTQAQPTALADTPNEAPVATNAEVVGLRRSSRQTYAPDRWGAAPY